MKKRLNTHSVNAGTYRPDGALSTKNTQKITHYFILSALTINKAASRLFQVRHAALFSPVYI